MLLNWLAWQTSLAEVDINSFDASQGGLNLPTAVGGSDIPHHDAAFVLSAIGDPEQRITLHWQILPNTYMYRHAFEVTVVDSPAGTESGLTLGELVIPPGKKYKDDYFGEVETYRYDVTLQVPIVDLIEPSTIQVRYQGCADAGICYPPQWRRFIVEPAAASSGFTILPATTTTNSGIANNPNNGASAGNQLPTTNASAASVSTTFLECDSEEQNRTEQLAEDFDWWSVLQFFFGGLLLAFTPCVFPMAPILSRLIIGPSGITRGPRAFGLSLTYITSTAVVFALAGAVVGAIGSRFVEQLQQPFTYMIFAGLFAVLALSMFGLFKLELPSSIQTKVTALSNQQKPGSFIGATGMGVLAAFLVSGCATPFLAAALLQIAQSGDAVKGALALFLLAMGMGTPMVILATVAGHLLPHAGTWMKQVQTTIGIIMLAMGLIMLHHTGTYPELLWAWLALYVLAAVVFLWRRPRSWRMLLVTWVLLTGTAYMGAESWLTQSYRHYTGTEQILPFQPIKGMNGLQQALTELPRGQTAFLDIYADTCVACVEMEQTVFYDPAVQQSMAELTLLKADVTQYDEVDYELLDSLNIPGQPAYLFFRKSNHTDNNVSAADFAEIRQLRIIGKMSTEDFLQRLRDSLTTSCTIPSSN